MTSGNQNSADYPVLSHYHHYPRIRVQLKVVLSIASLCFLVLVLASCGQLLEGQSSNTSNPKQVNQVSHSQITYVAIGASDTFGIGTSDPYTQNWPTDLAEKLGQKIHLINLGIPGITLHDALNLELPVALDSHPELVTIWLGVDDLANHVPISSYSHDNQQVLHQSIEEYNATIANLSQEHHAILVDLSQQNYNLREHPEYISNDGLHATDLGYLQLAELFYKTLQQSQG